MDSIHSPVEHGENPKEATMKTPHAILIGLSLIAAAIFFKDTALKPAHAYNPPATKADVKEAIKECLHGASFKEKWNRRNNMIETLYVECR